MLTVSQFFLIVKNDLEFIVIWKATWKGDSDAPWVKPPLEMLNIPYDSANMSPRCSVSILLPADVPQKAAEFVSGIWAQMEIKAAHFGPNYLATAAIWKLRPKMETISLSCYLLNKNALNLMMRLSPLLLRQHQMVNQLSKKTCPTLHFSPTDFKSRNNPLHSFMHMSVLREFCIPLIC